MVDFLFAAPQFLRLCLDTVQLLLELDALSGSGIGNTTFQIRDSGAIKARAAASQFF